MSRSVHSFPIKEIGEIKKILKQVKYDNENDTSIFLHNEKSYKEAATSLTKHLMNSDEGQLETFLSEFNKTDLQRIAGAMFYGRAFLDGSIDECISYDDYVDRLINEEKDIIIDSMSGKYRELQKYFESAIYNFFEHEIKIDDNLKKRKYREKRYQKKKGHSFHGQDKKDMTKSTTENFKKIKQRYGVSETEDITQAKSIIKDIIDITDGLVIVDFLNGASFDSLEFVEENNGILSLYWIYSRESKLGPHNIRVDLDFEKLMFLDIEENLSIVIKGQSKGYKELKNYYYSLKSTKNNVDLRDKNLFFIYNFKFDRVQNGGLENFHVDFLPWRYYSLIILPKKTVRPAFLSEVYLISSNFSEIENRIRLTYERFKKDDIKNEDDLSQYVVRYRKIFENLLKFVCLYERLMFNISYEKDMLGDLIDILKGKIDEEIRDEIKTIRDSLNPLSHEMTKCSFDGDIINDLNKKMIEISDKLLKFLLRRFPRK